MAEDSGSKQPVHAGDRVSRTRRGFATFARLAVLLPLFAAASLASTAEAAVIYSASSGTRAASANFSSSGTTLTITLTNTSSADVVDAGGVLTALFFDLGSGADPLLTKTSAVSGGDTYSKTAGLVSAAGTPVGGEWAYLNGLNQYGANSGISSAGLDLFGKSNRFPGNNLFGVDSPSGVEYGITSAGDNAATANGGLDSDPLTRNSVIFTLTGFNGSLNDISNVTFQYGGNPRDDVHLSGSREGGTVPEPGTLSLLGLGLVGVALLRRRRQ